MSDSAKFSIGFLKMACDDEANREHMFLSVTPGFEHGPGIQRDGITAPRMRDPHCVPYVCDSQGLIANKEEAYSVDPYIQRAGTWTLYHHVYKFAQQMGKEWQIIGVQSCGDLTMNEWHLAYLGSGHYIRELRRKLCALLTENDPREPFTSRVYRCIVKWNDKGAGVLKKRYEAVDLEIEEIASGYQIRLENPKEQAGHKSLLKLTKNGNVAPFLEFALSGKPIVEKGMELPLSSAIDRFLDVRHIFNLPWVAAKGIFQGQVVENISLGEYQLFKNLNERRAALFSPVIIDLTTDGFVQVNWADVEEKLDERHFKKSTESPTRRNRFRGYPDEVRPKKVEIFFPHNVYPFGVLGINSKSKSESERIPKEIVCLASGGLSGRVGNTLEGITRIMYDFFACDDAIVLDEGYDTFHIINPGNETDGSYMYSNEKLLDKVLKFTTDRIDEDQQNSLNRPETPAGMKGLLLNKKLILNIEEQAKQVTDPKISYDDVLAVPPNRSQMRSVIIFAARK